MIVTYTANPRITNTANLADTSFHTLIACVEKDAKTLESLTASCGGTGTDFTLVFNDGTTDFFIANAKSIAAHDTYMLDNHHIIMKKGQSLKVKASNANQISVVAVTIDGMPVRSTGAPGT